MSLPEDQDFQPSEAIPLRAHATYLLCAVMVIAFGLWSAVSTLDIVSVAQGEVVPSTSIQTVQHLEGGIVREVRVSEGNRVTAGQALVVLEPTASSADVGELNERLIARRLDIARLEALADGLEEPSFDEDLTAEYPGRVAQTRRRFSATQADQLSKITRQTATINQRRQEIAEIEARLTNGRKSLKLVSEQVQISEGLIKKNLTNRFVHLNLLKEQQELEGGISTDRASLSRAKAGLVEAEAELTALQKGFYAEIQAELDDTRLNFRELTQRIQKFTDSLDRTVVRAPVDGTIKTIHVTTVGGVIRPGDPVVDVVPGDDPLVVEAKLATSDIGFVAVGQPAKVSLASADAQRFGDLPGRVTHVSPDTLLDPDGNPFYQVKIETEEQMFENNGLIYNLFPGLQVMTSIQTGERTVLQYLVDPFMGNMDAALQER